VKRAERDFVGVADPHHSLDLGGGFGDRDGGGDHAVAHQPVALVGAQLLEL